MMKSKNLATVSGLSHSHRWNSFLVDTLRRANYWASRRLRPGFRTVAGLLFIIGGILGFLPILGFWMIPVGLFLIAMEVPRLRTPMRQWINRRKLHLLAAEQQGQS